MDEAIDYIRKENPDIIALQEVYAGTNPAWERRFRTMEVLKKELGYPYEAFAPTFLEVKDFGEIQQGSAILSRYPIVQQESFFFDVPYGKRLRDDAEYSFTPRNVQRVAIALPDTVLTVCNTQGIWGTDGLDNERRLEMGRIIEDVVKDVSHLVLTGDFNVRPGTKTIQGMEKHLTNVFQGELKSTFNMKQKTHPVFEEIVVDMLFVSPDIRVGEHTCLNVNVSDHLPLLAKLTLE